MERKKWLIIVVFAMIACLGAGCTQLDVVGRDDNGPDGGKDGNIRTRFTLNVLSSPAAGTKSFLFTSEGSSVCTVPSGVESKGTTADPGYAQEDKISGLWVGQYKDGVKVTTEYVDQVITITDHAGSVELSLDKGEGYNLYFIANAGNLTAQAATENDLKALINTFSSADGTIPAIGFPMSGKLENVTIDSKNQIVGGGIVNLERLVAKLEFTFQVGTGFTFTPTGLAVKNVADKTLYIANGTKPEGQTAGTFTEAAATPGTSYFWYVQENLAGKGANTTEEEKTGLEGATYIELTGDAEQGGVAYTGVTYKFYPGGKQGAVNVADYNVHRNNWYKLTVTLAGINLTDKRVTVTGIPAMDARSRELDSTPGSGGKDTVHLQVTARPGVAWTLTPDARPSEDWLLVSWDEGANYNAVTKNAIAGSGPCLLIFKAKGEAGENTRKVTFTYAETGTGGRPGTQTVVISQAKAVDGLVIDADMLAKYKAAQSNLTAYPPFDYNSSNRVGKGATLSGTGASIAIEGRYGIEVEPTQKGAYGNYSTQQSYCSGLGSGWRIPTQIELFAIWYTCKGSNNDATDNEPESTLFGAKFSGVGSNYYWSSSRYNGSTAQRCILYFIDGNFGYYPTSGSQFVRCVRASSRIGRKKKGIET